MLIQGFKRLPHISIDYNYHFPSATDSDDSVQFNSGDMGDADWLDIECRGDMGEADWLDADWLDIECERVMRTITSSYQRVASLT